MAKQLSMFQPSMKDASGLVPVEITARRSDPVTSHQAANKKRVSGKAQQDRDAIMRALERRDGCTAGEIAAMLGDGWDNVRVSRRLPELEEENRVRRGQSRSCQVKGSDMVTWWLLKGVSK